MHNAVSSTIVLATTEPTFAPPPARDMGDIVGNGLPDRMRHHFQPGDTPQPQNLTVFSEPYNEASVYIPRGYPGEEYSLFDAWGPRRTVMLPEHDVSYYTHTRGPKTGKTIAHKGEWTAKEVEYSRAHGLVLQDRGTRRGTDRRNEVNRREALKRLLSGRDISP